MYDEELRIFIIGVEYDIKSNFIAIVVVIRYCNFNP
jgi:hypothetical protein